LFVVFIMLIDPPKSSLGGFADIAAWWNFVLIRHGDSISRCLIPLHRGRVRVGLPLYPKHTPAHKRNPAQHLPQHHRASNGCDEGKGIDKPYRERCTLEP
jgi:hypothetical protein